MMAITSELIEVSDLVWRRCFKNQKIEISCVSEIYHSLSPDVQDKISADCVNIIKGSIFLRKLLGNCEEQSDDKIDFEKLKIFLLIRLISYAENSLNNLPYTSLQMRETKLNKIADSLNISTEDVLNLDQEWGKLFYSS